MATKGGGYVVVYITPIFFYSGQSLSDGNRFRLRYRTLAQHSWIVNLWLRIAYISTRTAQLWGILGAFSLSDGTQANLFRLRSNCFCTSIVNKFSIFWCKKNTEIFDVTHSFVRSPPFFHLKWFPTTTTFGEIILFLNNVVAYSFTYTMISAQFLRNVPNLRYI